MVNKCLICRNNTLVFIWSTSKVIDKEKLEQIEQFKNVVNLERIAHPICLVCAKEYNLIANIDKKEEKYATQEIQKIIKGRNWKDTKYISIKKC